MAANKELKIKLSAEDKLSPAMVKAVDNVNNLNTGLVNLNAGLGVAKNAFEIFHKGWEKISENFHKAVEEALEGEKANNRLSGALVQSGNYTTALNKELNEHVDTLERVVGANGEVAKGFISTGLQMGLNVEKAKELEQASRQLAAANGISATEAFNALQMAMLGQARQLQKYIPQVKELGAAQLKQGAAIGMVLDATKEQYKIYQGSLPAALDRAETAYGNVYKAIGNIITQNPMVIKGVQMLADGMTDFAGSIDEANTFIKLHLQEMSRLGEAFVKTVAIFGAIGAAAGLATLGFSGLAAAATAAWTAITGPVGLVVIGVSALTAALYKWPPLFDVIVGTTKALGATLLTLVSGPILLAAEAAGMLAGIFDEKLGKSITDLADKVAATEVAWIKSGAAQAIHAVDALQNTKVIEKSTTAVNDSNEANLTAVAIQNRLKLAIQDTYGGYTIGTLKQREALAGEAQDRDKALKNFTDYLTNRKRLAITSAEEQQIEVAKLQAGATKGSGGEEDLKAQAGVAIDIETRKQAELKVLHDKHIIDDAQYNEALSASQDSYFNAQIDVALAHQQALANALGNTDEAFQLKLQMADERFQVELQQKMAQAEMEDITQAQRNDLRLQLEDEHHKTLEAMNEEFNNTIADQDNSFWASANATRNKDLAGQKKAQDLAIKEFYSGVTMRKSIQEQANRTSSVLGDELVKNQRISTNKVAGIFLEGLGRQVQQKGFADLIMSVWPPNPVQAATGAGEVAIGTGIARMGAEMQSSRAHDGMTEIPSNLDNKSFVLQGGERVVATNQNADLKEFLSGQKTGKSNSQTINITLNYSGSGGRADADSMADIVLKEIRRRSEMGVPIMSSKGVTS